jgi:ElaB/YqjD/DUF883 family membrane-anchored ribosome-binding protein
MSDKNVAGAAVRIVEEVGRATEAVADLGRQTVGSVDAQRRPVAATLEHTASALHHQTDRVARVGHTAADRLRATANYVRGNDLNAMAKDVADIVRRHPGQALIAAAAAGFVVAQVVRRRS